MKDLASIKSSRAEIEAELRIAGSKIKGGSCTCPFHGDKTASASLKQYKGVWYFRCHAASCKFKGDVIDARAKRLGITVAECIRSLDPHAAKPEQHEDSPKPKRVFFTPAEIAKSMGNFAKVEDVYEYTNPDTQLIEVVQVRYRDEEGKKHFCTYQPNPDGEGFVLGAPPKPWPLFNRSMLRKSDRVVVVEGEKKVKMLRKLGVCATCSLSGAENAASADWSEVVGKEVYHWRDNDDAGSIYTSTAISEIERLQPATRQRKLDISSLNLPEGGGVDDFIERENPTAEEIWRLLEDGSDAVGTVSPIVARVEATIDGTWKDLGWKWPCLSRASKSLFPGSEVVICGSPGASKSFLDTEAWMDWNDRGIPADILHLERNKALHQMRMLAILSGKWDVLDDEWGRENCSELLNLLAEHEAHIHELSARLFCRPAGQMRYKEINEWMQDRLDKGTKIFCVDPITAVATGDSRYGEDLKFITDTAKLLEPYGACLVMVTHPRGMKSRNISLDDLAGGMAFSRHTQAVFILETKSPPVEYVMQHPSTGSATFPEACNRVLKIVKTSDGRGNGWRIGMNQGSAVRFVEHGVIVEKKKSG